MTPVLKNTLSLLGIAAFTMATTLVAINSSVINAGSGDDPTLEAIRVEIKPVIAQPTLEDNGCKFSIKMDKENYAETDKPVLTVDATNTGKEAITRSVVVTIYSRDLNSRSRMPAMALPLFTKTVEFSLAAGETKTVTVETETTLPAAHAVSLGMSTGNANAEIEKVVPRAKRIN